MPSSPTIARVLALVALVIFAITTFLFFEVTGIDEAHLHGGLALGLTFLAAAKVA